MEKDVNAMIHGRDEINLLDLWKIIYSEKYLVLVVTLICLAVAGIYIIFSKPIYESSVVLKIGQVGQVGQVEDVPELIERLKLDYHMNDSNISFPKLSKVRHLSGKSFVEIRALGQSPEEAQKYIRDIAAKLIKDHESLYHQAVVMKKNKLKALQGQLKQTHVLNKKNGMKPDMQDSQIAALVFLLDSKLNEQLIDLTERAHNLSVSLLLNNTFPTVIKLDATFPQSPIKPRKGFIIMLSILLGLMLGMLIAFGRNAMRQNNLGRGTGINE